MQVLKEDVREKILQAAIRVFRDAGYLQATISQIAGEAGVSTGNVYRYFPNKEALFDSVLPLEFARSVKSRLEEVLSSATRLPDLFAPRLETQHYRKSAQQLLWSTAIERDRLVILLEQSQGTRFEDQREEILRLLEIHAIRYAESVKKDFKLSALRKSILRLIYSSFLDNVCKILRESKTEADVFSQLEAYRLYHLTGLKHFLERA